LIIATVKTSKFIFAIHEQGIKLRLPSATLSGKVLMTAASRKASSRFSTRRYALSEAMPQALRSNSKFKIQN